MSGCDLENTKIQDQKNSNVDINSIIKEKKISCFNIQQTLARDEFQEIVDIINKLNI